MRFLNIILLVFIFSLLSVSLRAQSPVGTWKTYDDKTGEPKAHIEIFEVDGLFYGRLTKLLHEPVVDFCNRCRGERRNQPLEGLIIIENIRTTKKQGRWRGGRILDPVSGNTYSCSMWFEYGEFNTLKVRAKHWSGIYRTQIWEKTT